MYRPIRDYAIIGNLRSAALVSRDGAIDWAPAPFIDSPSVFAAILDDEHGGSWEIHPTAEYTSKQEYIHNTNVLVTHFTTHSGELQITDFFPVEAGRELSVLAEEEDTTFRIYRKIECVRGEVETEIDFTPEFDYARGETALFKTRAGVFARHVVNGKHAMLIAPHIPFSIGAPHTGGAHARMKLKEGNSHFLVLRYNAGQVITASEDRDYYETELARAIEYWQSWAAKYEYEGMPRESKWQDSVNRSLLALKILFFEPVGTVAAAATTSLPEAVGYGRNWDYRFTWIRDSSFIFEAFFRSGHVYEAQEYVEWLFKTCYAAANRDPSQIQIMYGLQGQRNIPEQLLPHLKGYRESAPVRIGNEAYTQKQWDIYGNIIDLAWRLHEARPGAITEGMWDAICEIVNYVCDIWREPDEGVWEVREMKEHFVYSKVMCWVAIDRGIRLGNAYQYGCNIERWEREKAAIYDAVMEHGWNEDLQSFVYSFDSQEFDSAMLLLSKVGFLPGDDPKMISTIRNTRKHLECDDGLLYRYRFSDGMEGNEGVFLIASFWLIDALVLAGELAEAEELFERIRSHANHVGLFSEEMDPHTGDFLGNFPQAYTHLGLINSAFLLEEALERQKKVQ